MDHSAIVMKTSTAMHYKVSSHKEDNRILSFIQLW
jgi:hypothetical protein